MISLEIYQQGCLNMGELYDFWMSKWNEAFQKMIGQTADPQLFTNQSYFYVIRSEGKIVGVMSSTWQILSDDLKFQEYYAAYPQGLDHLRLLGVQSFHKMGMICAEFDSLPKGFKLVPVLIGCGLKFTSQLSNCDGVVSFPRTDTSVYRSCRDWGGSTMKSGLTMYNRPVSFMFIQHFDVTKHPSTKVSETVNDLWLKRLEFVKPAILLGK